MIKQHRINEVKKTQKLPVVYSDDVINKIEYIKENNLFEKEGLERLFFHIKGIENYISNRAIAFDYGNNFARDTDGTVIVYDMGISFLLVDKSGVIFVEIVGMDLNLGDFGLQESRNVDISRIIAETINSYLKKNSLLAS